MTIPIVAVTTALLLGVSCTPVGHSGSESPHLLPPETKADETFGAHTPERIIAECTRAITNDSACAWAYYYRALAWASFGVVDEARRDMNRAIRLDDSYRQENRQLRKVYNASSKTDERLASCTGTHYLSAQSIGSSDPAIPLIHSSITSDSYSSIIDGPRSSSPDNEGESGGASCDRSDSGSTNSGNSPGKDSANATTCATDTTTSDSVPQRNKFIQSLIRKEIGTTGKRESRSETDRQKRRAFLPRKDWETDRENRAGAERSKVLRDSIAGGSTDSAEKVSTTHPPGIPSRNECPELVMGDTVTVYFCLAKMYYKHKEYKKALYALKQITKRERRHSEAYLWKAKTLGAQGRYRKALRAANRSIRINSTNPKAFSIRAWIHHCRGNFRKEAENLREALTLGYDKPDIIKVRLEAIADKVD